MSAQTRAEGEEERNNAKALMATRGGGGQKRTFFLWAARLGGLRLPAYLTMRPNWLW